MASPVKTVAASIKARLDGWTNVLTGAGVDAYDKRNAATYSADIITYATGLEIYRGNDVGARMVDVPIEDALRNGFDFVATSSDDDEGEIDTKEIQEQVETRWQDLGVMEAIEKAWQLERSTGGAIIFLGVEDNGDLESPLDDDVKVRKFSHLTVFDRQEAQVKYWHGDITAPEYGEPQFFNVQKHTPGPSKEHSEAVASMLLHESRALYFGGIKPARQVLRGQNDGFGDGIFTRAWPVLRDFGGAWDSTGSIVQEFAHAVFKMQGLSDLLATEQGEKLIQARLRALQLSRSTLRASLIDGEEDYTRQSTPINGLSDLLEAYMGRLSAACGGMPITKIFGTSPGGLNSTGESDIAQWDDRVRYLQTRKVVPMLERVTKIILAELGIKVENWSIKPRALRQQTDKEIAETRNLQAQTDQIYVDMQVLSSEEVANSRFGGDSYSLETVIDWDDRAALEIEIEAEQKAAEAAQALAAAQQQPGAAPTEEESADPGPDDKGQGVENGEE